MGKKGVLRIDGIDLEMLEKQRLALVELLEKVYVGEFPPEEVRALEGVINMLDHWSDGVYRKEHPVTLKNPVHPNMEQRLFVIPSREGYTCLGFDVCYRLTEALAKELDMITNLPIDVPTNPEALMGLYYLYKTLCLEVQNRYDKTGFRSMVELHPQLIGLEGKRVEVVDQDDLRYRFQVGKSSGYIPCHIQLTNRNSTGGGCVDPRPFKSVRIV